MPPEERVAMTLMQKKISTLFLIYILFIIVYLEEIKNSEYPFFITVLSSKYLK